MKLLENVVYLLVVCFVLFLLFAFVQGSFDPMGWDKKVRALLSWFWGFGLFIYCIHVCFNWEIDDTNN